jgi:hypothetical protein
MKTQQRSEERLVEAPRPLVSLRGDRLWVVGARGVLPPGRTTPPPAEPSKWLREELT